jgi:hypothetical protein
MLAKAALMPVNVGLGPTARTIGITCILVSISAAALCLIKGRDSSARLVGAGVTLAVLGLAPALPYLSRNLISHESRYLSISGAGLALLAAAVIATKGRWNLIIGTALMLAWASATVAGLGPWMHVARCRDVIQGGIDQVTAEPGRHDVWVEGPINEYGGAHLFGGFLEHAVRLTLPDRDIDVDSAFFQRYQGRPVGPATTAGRLLHVLRFSPEPPRIDIVERGRGTLHQRPHAERGRARHEGLTR